MKKINGRELQAMYKDLERYHYLSKYADDLKFSKFYYNLYKRQAKLIKKYE